MTERKRTTELVNTAPDATVNVRTSAGVFPVEDAGTLGFSGGTIAPATEN